MRLPGRRRNTKLFVVVAPRPPPSKLLIQVARAPRTKVICASSIHAKRNTTFPKVLFPSHEPLRCNPASASFLSPYPASPRSRTSLFLASQSFRKLFLAPPRIPLQAPAIRRSGGIPPCLAVNGVPFGTPHSLPPLLCYSLPSPDLRSLLQAPQKPRLPLTS